MKATQMLKQQHRDVEKLFAEFEQADESAKQAVFDEIANQLAMHAKIEELHFYPAVKVKDTEQQLKEAVEEHQEAKKLIAECMEMHSSDSEFESKVIELKEAIEHHVGEEEGELFPKVERLFTVEELDLIAEAMENTMAELMAEGEPRQSIPAEAQHAPQI
jgi:hemerythrin superfamily protein